MPTAADKHLHGELVCEMGPAGSGKSEFAVQAPQPHAILCVDKPVIAALPDSFPGYNPALSFGKFYPPPAKDLTNDKEKPSRNIFDEIIKDIEALKSALKDGNGLDMAGESWPLPRTIIVEGMDFIRDHCVNWVLNTQGKYHMDEFLTADGRPNVFLGWGLVAAKMDELFQNLSFLPAVRPVNVIVTIGLDEETKRIRDDRGRESTIKTGNFDPAFGGKMSIEAPRKFRDCWLTEKAAGKYFIHTAQTDKTTKFRGLRAGRFGLKAVEDVTIDLAKPINHWNRLFG